MKNYTSLNLYLLNKAEFVQFMTATIDALLLYNQTASNPQLQTLANRLEANLSKLQASLVVTRGSDRTETMTEQLKVRDEAYQTLQAGLRFHKYSSNAEKVAAYKHLSRLIKQSGYSTRKNQQEAFALMDSLIAQFGRSPYKEAVEQLGLSEVCASLEASQKLAYQLFFQRNQENKGRISTDWEQIRKMMQQDYRTLLTYITTQIAIDPSGVEQDLLLSLDGIRKTFSKTNRVKSVKPNNPVL